jgi:hypothetical protein
MSWYQGFGTFGSCGNGQASPFYRSKPPANQDFSGDGHADVIGRLSSDNNLYLYQGNGQGGWGQTGIQIGTNWSAFNWLLGPLGFSADGCIDVSARRSSDGSWRLYEGNCASGWKSSDLFVASGFSQYNSIVAPGDWDGDGCADIIGRRSSDSSLWLHRGNCGTGFSGSASQIGTSFGAFNMIIGGGDFSGDGCNDLVLRRASDGALRLYQGNCAGGWGLTDLSMGYSLPNMNAIWGPGDFNGDGCVDLIARDASTGSLNLYRGNCAGGFSGVTANIGTGWGGFDFLW